MDKKFRIGFIGYGLRGPGVLKCFIAMDDVEIVAVCDRFPERQQKAAEAVKEVKGYTPICTDNYKDLFDMELDAIINIGAWADHTHVAIQSMEAGIPIAFEVGGAYTIEECWDLVKAYERTKVPCMMLTNTRYNQQKMALVNMARQGVFGKIVHCDGGYCHDLRKSMVLGHDNEHHYRLSNYMLRNSDCYPCHALGVILSILDINRGNKMVSLSSVASCSAGLNAHIQKTYGPEHHLANYNFAQGDIVTTTITCARGETISLRLDTTLPRAYSQRFEIHGTNGLFMEDGNMVYLEDEHTEFREEPKKLYNNADEYLKKYEHRLWEGFEESTDEGDLLNTGHGGTDYKVTRAFVESVKNGAPMITDVYDAAILMCITALSEESIAKGGAPVAVPDFTKGAYLTRKAITEEENKWSI